MLGKGKNEHSKGVESPGGSAPAKSTARIDHVLVSSESKKAKRQLPKLRPTKVALAALLVVALVAGGVLVMKNMKARAPEPPQVSPNIDYLLDASHDLEESGNYKAAIEVFDDAVERLEGKQKADVLMIQATIALRNNAHQDALPYAQRSVDTYPTPEALTLAGSIANKLNQTDDAISFYKRALEEFKKQEIREIDEEQAVEKIIANLEKSR